MQLYMRNELLRYPARGTCYGNASSGELANAEGWTMEGGGRVDCCMIAFMDFLPAWIFFFFFKYGTV